MNTFSIIYLITIGIFTTITLQQFTIWIQNKKEKVYLIFSIAAMFATSVAIGEYIMLSTSVPEKYEMIMRWFQLPLAGMLVGLTWFIKAYMKPKGIVLPGIISLLWGIYLVMNFASRSNLTFHVITAVEKVYFSENAFYYLPIGVLNNWRLIADLASVLFLAYIISSSIGYYKKGNKQQAIVLGGSILIFMLIAGITTPLNDLGLIHIPITISFPFVFIIIAISIELTRDVALSKEVSEQLLAEEKRWADLKQNAKLLILETDCDYRLSYLSPFFTELTGYQIKDLPVIGWFEEMVPETAASKNQATYDKLKTGANSFNYNSQIKTKRGEIIDINWTTIAHSNEKNELTGIVGIGTDITENRKYYREIESLKILLERENLLLKEKLKDSTLTKYPQIIGESHASIYAQEKAMEVAPTQSIVLLEGETGVGKEVFARLIHENSQRDTQEFLKINCSAIPHELIESELFGHEKGSFTGAGKMRRGIFERAHGGTLFLDEVGELPLNLQPKLLRVLQDGEFQRVGGEKTIRTNVRIIAATNRVLSDEIERGNFRNDLYFRLNVFPITIPPLRKRKEDIPLFIGHFVELYAEKYDKIIKRVSKHTYESFQKHHWPGNIRELQNVIERAVIIAKSDILKTNGLLHNGSDNVKTKNPDTPIYSLQEVERQHIIHVLKESNWQVHGEAGAAHKLKVNPNTLRSKIKKLNIEKDN